MAVSIASCTTIKTQSPNFSRITMAFVTMPRSVVALMRHSPTASNVPSGVPHATVSIALPRHSSSPSSSRSAIGYTLKTWGHTPSAPQPASTVSGPVKCFTSRARTALQGFWDGVMIDVKWEKSEILSFLWLFLADRTFPGLVEFLLSLGFMGE